MKKMRNVFVLAATAGAIAASNPASAAELMFNLSGPNTAVFNLDFDPVMPDGGTSSSFFERIDFNNVAGVFNGTAATARNIRFDNRLGPALVINGSPLGIASFQGDDLFTGTGANPVFKQGTFTLTSATLGGSYQLSISPVLAGAVPEPATWALLLLGFGVTGYAMRRKTKVHARLSYC